MRSIWKGALSFGLIHIPVRLYSAAKQSELKFKMLHKKDLGEIRFVRVCKADGEEVPWSDIVKGYQYDSGDYVILTEEDFEKVNLKKTKTIEILNFTNKDEIDSMYFDTPYYLEPEKGAEKAYSLLLEALTRSKKVAIGQFAFHHHEHLGAITPHDNLLVVNTLRYEDEIVKPKDLNIEKKESSKKEIDMALELIETLTKHFHPKEYHDAYVQEVKAMIERKAKGKKAKIIKAPPPSPKIHDIMSLLKDSLKETKRESKKRKAA